MMNREKFIPQLEEVLEMPPGTLREEEEVHNLAHWDSLKLLQIIALADEQLDVQMDADKLAQCRTVGEMLRLMETTATPSQN